MDSICLTKYSFSKLVCAEVSKITGASKQVFHQTVNAQNSMLTKEIHDQGKINLILNGRSSWASLQDGPVLN